MEAELIVVDENDNEDDLVQVDDEGLIHPLAPPQIQAPISLPPSTPPVPSTPVAATSPIPSTSTQIQTQSASIQLQSSSGRTMRTSNNNPYATRNSQQTSSSKQPKKLKLKLGAKASAQAPNASFLGSYDRELDSDVDEEGGELLFEEQFIVKMPPGEDCEKLRKMIQSREVTNDVWFKFKDSRRAHFHIGKNAYTAKLVDLPCIVESQKTFDNKHMFKVADISQMLVVEEKINPTNEGSNTKSFNVEEFIWPHGITPPLHWVRKRRFRKRVNRRTIETVEEEVERLLSEDALADTVQYEVLENVNPDLSDSEFIDRDDAPQDIGTPIPGDSEAGDAPTPAAFTHEGDGDHEGSDEEQEGDFDEELAAELDLALGSQDSSEGDSDEEGEGRDAEEGSGEDGEDDEDDEDDDIDSAETKRARKLLNEEIRDLEAAVNKKSMEIERSLNPLIRRRFEDALRKLRTDLELKIMQRTQLEEDSRLRKEAAAEEAAEQEAMENVAIPEGANAEGGVSGVVGGVGVGVGPSGTQAPSSRKQVQMQGNTLVEENEDDDLMDDDMADLFGTDTPAIPVPVPVPVPVLGESQPLEMGDSSLGDSMDIG